MNKRSPASARGPAPPGTKVPAYELFLGGSFSPGDTRFGQRIKTKVPAKRLPEAFRMVVEDYKKERNDGEEFKDYVLRAGNDHFEGLLTEFKEIPELGRETLDQYIDWSGTVKYILGRGEGECAV